MSPLLRSRPDDAALAAAVAGGDEQAFARIDERHRKPLERYARRLVSEHDAQDVVQDVLVRAHALLASGERPAELRPWLYRLVRNRAIDEVRRARWGAEALDELHAPHDERSEPEAVLSRRENVRHLVSDLADLPVRQRTALLAREIDGLAPGEVAEQLGVSVAAAQMLAARARENLVKARDARDAECPEVRAELADAVERGVRASEHARRHVAGCSACRAWEKDLRRVSRRLQALAPPVGLLPLALAGKLLGGGKAAGGAAAAVLAVTGGVIVLTTSTAGPGDPAPFELKGVQALVGRKVQTGDRIPRGTAVVTAQVRIPAGAPTEQRSVTLACPPQMKVAGLAAPEQRFPASYGLSKDTIIGHSTRARIELGSAILPRDYDITVGATCRKPGATGSLSDTPRQTRRGEQAAKVCVDQAYVLASPGQGFVGTVFRDQPVSVLRRSASGKWVRIVSDIGTTGWLRASAVC